MPQYFGRLKVQVPWARCFERQRPSIINRLDVTEELQPAEVFSGQFVLL